MEVFMDDYKKMYLHLFNAVTDALETGDCGGEAAAILRAAQAQCEEIYIAAGDSEPDNGKK